jgi:predicted ester cyclase
MSTGTAAVDAVTGFSHEEMKSFIRNHFEDFVNRQDLGAADRNFAPSFLDHGDDVPSNLPPGIEGAKQYLAAAFKRFPDIHVTIEDMVAEGDKVVVRNWWTATDSQSGDKIEFRGIVIWRIENRKIVERWAYLQRPHPAA